MKSQLRNLSIALLLFGAMQQSLAVAQDGAMTTIGRGSLSPSAPVKLDYRIEHSVVANQQNSVAVEISTRLDHGSLLVEVAKQQGVALLGRTQRRFDLATVARPIKFDLPVMPGDQSERFLIVLLTADTEMGQMSRSFRIDLSDPVGDDTAQPISP